MRKNPTRLQELEQENSELEDTLEEISDLASEADDAALTREELIEKIRAIAELSEPEEEESGAESQD
jgi:type II secretory pathway component PulM